MNEYGFLKENLNGERVSGVIKDKSFVIMGDYCVILEGDKNLSDECLSQMLLT